MHRCLVVVDARRLRIDDGPQELPSEGRILELVAAGTARHEEAGQIALVVQRHPVLRYVVQRCQANRAVGHAELGNSPRNAHHRHFELFDSGVFVVVVGVVNPVQFIALWLGAPNQPGATELGAQVVTDVEVGDGRHAVLQAQPVRRLDGEHFLPQRTMADAHAFHYASHLIDDARMWAADVDDDRG